MIVKINAFYQKNLTMQKFLNALVKEDCGGKI